MRRPNILLPSAKVFHTFLPQKKIQYGARARPAIPRLNNRPRSTITELYYLKARQPPARRCFIRRVDHYPRRNALLHGVSAETSVVELLDGVTDLMESTLGRSFDGGDA